MRENQFWGLNGGYEISNTAFEGLTQDVGLLLHL